jgi:hypothetical protein
MPLSDRHDLTANSIEPGSEELSPSGYLEVELTLEERKAFENWIEDHYRAISDQMADTLARFEQERNQHEGKMPGADYPYAGAFRVNYPITKKKAREVANRLKQAYLDSDPIWAIGTDKLELKEYSEKAEKAIDAAVRNELDEEDDLAQVVFDGTLHGSGFIVPSWLYTEEVRRDVETYKGFDGVNPQTLEPLFDFEKRYPNWKDEKKARELHGKIARGEDVTEEVSYTVAVKNQPNVQHVEPDKVRVYPSVDGYEGLRSTPIYGFVKTFTRSQLEDLARDGQIEQAQLDLLLGNDGLEKPAVQDEIEEYDVFIATARYQLPNDKRPSRYKVWFAVEEHIILRIRQFQFWCDEPDLIPFYIRQEEPGFFKRGLAWDLQDDHVVLNVMLNLYLNAIDMANSMRWIVKKGSLAEGHLLARRWSPHLPIPYKDKPEEVVPNQQAMTHIAGIASGFELMRRTADESTNTSALQSGRESPTDPNAPATKTLLLLQQVEPNMKEYMRSLEPAFRQLGRWIVWLYYQGISLGWIDSLPGLPEMPVDQLPEIAKSLHPRALLFEFDRQGRTERNLKVLELLTSLAPMAIPDALKVTLSQIDSQWARLADTLNLQPPMPATPGQPGQPQGQPSANGNGNGAPDSMMSQMLGAVKDRVGAMQ